MNDKTGRFPLSRGGWRREVGVTLPQMDLLESSATAEGQSLSKFPAWLEIGWIAPKSSGRLARNPGLSKGGWNLELVPVGIVSSRARCPQKGQEKARVGVMLQEMNV